ncbi:MAG: vitamin K epoxide reductase [Parcubacteria group bacterium Athens0714_16]|nr:MAG: vitamin K epoxide reductase [Parcubacteria group bacterium Athens0714_16]
MMNKTDDKIWNKFFVFIIILFMVLSFVGIIDSVFLTVEHFKGNPALCLLVEGCDIVLTSQYSVILGIPVPILGFLYYFSIFCFAVFSFVKRKEIVLKYLSVFSIVGFLMSIWFVYLQIFVIKALCTYCLLSTFLSVSLLIFGIIFFVNFRKRNDGIEKIQGTKE